VLTDAYPREPVAYGDGSVPIRLIDLDAREETTLVRVPTPLVVGPNEALRVDPHPAWDRSYQLIAFNAFLDGTRRVCVADLGSLVS
jgi:hypothetical protein